MIKSACGNEHSRAMGHRGLTLIETLASLVILGLFVVAAGAWLVSSARASRSLTREADGRIHSMRVLGAIRDDLDAADPASIVAEEGTLRFVTANTLPGERITWASVTWSVADGTKVLCRASNASDEITNDPSRSGRAVLREVSAFVLQWIDPNENGPASSDAKSADHSLLRIRIERADASPSCEVDWGAWK